MKSDIKKLWLEDLRSGNYNQTRMTLKEPGHSDVRASYCCLGILCNIYNKQTGGGAWNKAGEFVSQVYCKKDGADLVESDILPDEVRAWSGLSNVNPSLQVGGKYFAVSTLNDGDGDEHFKLSFKEIANLIERQIPG